MHTRYLVDGPNIMDIITVELDEPWLHFETYRPDSLTRTTEQSLAVDGPGNRVVAAVNGDFFSFDTHWPIANQMVRGEFVHGVSVRNRHHFAVDKSGRPYLDALSFRGQLTLPDGTTHSVDGINHPTSNAEIVAFNGYFGTETPSGTGRLEIVLEPRPAEVPVNGMDRQTDTPNGNTTESGAGAERKTGKDSQAGNDSNFGNDKKTGLAEGSGIDRPMMVRSIHDNTGNTIPGDGYVVRVQDEAVAGHIRSTITTGDEVIFQAGFKSDHKRLTNVVGGGVRILDRGRPYGGSNEDRHPRTFVAIDRDTTTVYLCTVDGRQLTSVGMSYREMAAVLLELGAWYAVNLDGGGSTTMVIRNEVANSPSDPGGERRVANSLLLVSTAPEGDVSDIRIEPDSIELYPHESLELQLTAFDEFRNPVPLPEDLVWEYDSALGELQDFRFIPGPVDSTGHLRVRSGETAAQASIRIHHYTSLASDPSELHLAPGESRILTLTGTTPDGTTRDVPVSRTRFEQPIEPIFLNGTGEAHATGYGQGSLHLDIGSASVTVPYSVSGDAVPVVLEDFADGLSGWASPYQTHRAQILGVDPGHSTMELEDGVGVWTFVDDPERQEDWDIRITRHMRQELGHQLYGSHIGAWIMADDNIEIRLIIRDGDGELEAGLPVRVVAGQWQLIQTRLTDGSFEGYLNGDGHLTRESNQFNGFRITKEINEQQSDRLQLKIDRILASPFPLD
ncbi:MAG: phosphodiester glycosidase family protein [Bacteroidota bacterium]